MSWIRPLNSGDLRHRIKIERPVETQDAFGEVELAFHPFADRWAAIEPLRGRERMEADAVDARTTHRVLLRNLEVNPRDRLKYGARTFEVVSSIDPDERGIFIELRCEEKR